jgi:hypothetical protein
MARQTEEIQEELMGTDTAGLLPNKVEGDKDLDAEFYGN